MSKLFYPAIFHPEDVGYSVTVPDIGGCVSEGDSLEEAYEMITDAIGLCITDMLENGTTAPIASSPQNIKHEKDDFVVLVEFDQLAYTRRHDTKAVKKTLTIPSWLNTMAEEKHLNFSGILQDALKDQLNLPKQ
ncbi:type II toxin-antitoxin system HicB family antitoxin [Ethanoligenens sp.]|uniref:type II toxin-antitoxin system HicB family antitoxin n=1 Tax=Ethanoligenens sp. TaxID=2099655 RepID=UPI0039EB3B2F